MEVHFVHAFALGRSSSGTQRCYPVDPGHSSRGTIHYNVQITTADSISSTMDVDALDKAKKSFFFLSEFFLAFV